MIPDEQLTRFYLRLTRQQRRVLQLAAIGLTNREVGELLHIQPSVVAEHLTNIYAELGTLEAFGDKHPNRRTLIRAFAGFFERNPAFADV